MKKIFIIIFLVIITLGTKAQVIDSLSLAISRTEKVLDSIQNKISEYQKAMQNPYTSLTREAQLNVLDMSMETNNLFKVFLEWNKALQEKNKKTEEKLDFLIIQFKEMTKVTKEVVAENQQLEKENQQLKQQIKK